MRRIARERTVFCDICGSAFLTTHSQGKYCSDECRQIGWRKSWNKYSSKNRQARRNNHNRWYDNHKIEKAATVKAYQKTAKGKEASKISDANQRKKHPERYKVYLEVRKFKANGTLVPEPCIVCGSLKVHAHHSDYNKPLEVEWLCAQHHTDLHKEIRNEI